MDSFEDMPVWQKAMDLAVSVHGITSVLPKSEDYGLISQMRRAAVSITDNIAEGFGRGHCKDKSMFYIIARGSTYELKNQHIYGNKIKYFTDEVTNTHIAKCNEIIFELNRLIKAVKERKN